MWITLDQILSLQAVKDSGSINGASEKLNKAKSAISYSIQRLDDQLGFPTLDRSQYRIRLTPQGEAFLHKAQTLIKEMEVLKEESYKIASGVEMKLAMSATAIYPTAPLNKVLRQIISKFPSTEFTFHREILSGEKMLMNEQVDIAIFENLQNSIDIESKKISKIELKLVICADHPFLKLKKKEQTLKALTQYPHIIQRSTIQEPGDINMGISEDSKRWSVSDIHSKKDLILNNLGWGRLPDHFVEKELKQKKLVHLKHLDYDHIVDIYLCKKKNRYFGPVLDFLWNSF
jgi:DNA-binding transcriptional LysR family regulator